MLEIKIKQEGAQQRCEICHQSDLFNQSTGICARCASLEIALPDNQELDDKNSIFSTRLPALPLKNQYPELLLNNNSRIFLLITLGYMILSLLLIDLYAHGIYMTAITYIMFLIGNILILKRMEYIYFYTTQRSIKIFSFILFLPISALTLIYLIMGTLYLFLITGIVRAC